MSKHTPGPWLLSASGPTVYALHGTPERNRFSTYVMSGRRDDAQSEELLANARLIAAAPELLSALQHIARAKSTALALEYVQGLARAAIAKATGEQP